MRRHLLTLYLVTAMLHVVFAVALYGALGRWGRPSWWLASGGAALLAGAFHFRVALLRWDRPISPLRRWLEELYYAHWMALWLALPFAPLLALSLLAAGHLPAWVELVSLAYGVGLLIGGYGVLVRRRRVRVTHADVPIAGLAAAFDGFRIAQLSDLHVGSLCPYERALGWVETANALDVDLVALTGDYVTSGVRFHHDIADALGQLKARMGVYAVMGNHDYFGDGEPLLTLLAERGIVVLRNEHVVLPRADAELCLAGVDDIYTRRIDIDAAMAGRDEALPLVVLAHDPKSFEELADHGAALVLSGHTHWGQLALPFAALRFNLARAIARYHAGWFRRGDARLFVSPGLGTTGPPVRLGTWPEISVFTLRQVEAER